MKTVPLGELVDFYSGGTPSKAKPEYWSGDVPWFSAKDMKKPQLQDSADHVSEAVFSSTPLRKLPAGTIAMVVRGMILAHTAPISILNVDASINQDLKALLPKREIDTSFLAAMLRAQHSSILAKVSTAAHGTKKLESRVLEELPIPLPPLPEQRRIAAILDHADALRAKRRQVLAHLESLTQSIFRDMFGDPIVNSRGLPRMSLGSVATVMTGNSPSRADAGNFGDEIEWIKSDNLGGAVATRSEEFLSSQGRAKARVAPRGSVLVTCIAGSPASIGKASLVDRDVAFNQQINAILPSPQLDTKFLLGQLKTAPELVREKSTGGMKGLVNKSSFQSIELLVPPLDAQQEFAAMVDAIAKERTTIQRALSADDELFASLQSRAFAGEL